MENEINFEQELYKAFGQVKDFTLGMQIAKWFYNMGKNYQEHVSDDLEDEITDYINNHFSECEDGVLLSDVHSSELQYTDVADIARHFANWQKEKDMQKFLHSETATFTREEFDAEMEKVRKQIKEQMMKNATEVTVHVEAGNYPYIPQIELYDYDKDIPLANEGDKYKVILIKED